MKQIQEGENWVKLNEPIHSVHSGAYGRLEKDKPASHKNIGWEYFTDAIIKKVNEKDSPVVFILWGNFAKSKKQYITNSKHLVIESSHPSPFSCNYGFFGSKPFSKTNLFLKKNNIKEIDWKVY